MTDVSFRPGRKRFLIVALILCLVLLAALMMSRKNQNSVGFSVLIMGDSQMAGVGWQGGYANCLTETYPNALAVNLAQSGAHLLNGEIHAQWNFYLSETDIMPNFVLLDGGINDLAYLKQEKFPEGGFSLVSDAMCSLIEHIHAESPDTRIIYALMPPFAEWEGVDEGVPSYDIQQTYWKQLNAILSGYEYVTVVDFFSIDPFDYPKVSSYQKNLADNIHLSEAGYRNTFKYINEALEPHLPK